MTEQTSDNSDEKAMVTMTLALILEFVSIGYLLVSGNVEIAAGILILALAVYIVSSYYSGIFMGIRVR